MDLMYAFENRDSFLEGIPSVSESASRMLLHYSIHSIMTTQRTDLFWQCGLARLAYTLDEAVVPRSQGSETDWWTLN